jgi:hypothetical protein
MRAAPPLTPLKSAVSVRKIAFPMSLHRKIKLALDETRLLILGAQVLFGFQFNGVFQEAFSELPVALRILHSTGLVLLVIVIGLLITPSMQHRIVERGENTVRTLEATTAFAAAALFPLALTLGLDMFMAFERTIGVGAGVFAGIAVFLLAIAFWYLLEFVLTKRMGTMPKHEQPSHTPLANKVEEMLTEARVIIPGAQALLGFQLTVTLTRAFEQLPYASRLIHIVALTCVVVAVILLMAPAALHRITFGGEDSAKFLAIGSVFVIAAPLPLALGIVLDVYVAASKALDGASGAGLAILTTIVLAGLWYAYPVWQRWRLRAG